MSFNIWGWTDPIPLKDMPVQVKGDHYWFLFDAGAVKYLPIRDHRRNLAIAAYYCEPGLHLYTRVKRVSIKVDHGFGYVEFWLHLADGRQVDVWGAERLYTFKKHPEVCTY